MKFEKKHSSNVIMQRQLSNISDISDISNTDSNKDEVIISNYLNKIKSKKKLFGKQFADSLGKDLKKSKEKDNIISTSTVDLSLEKEAEESIKKKEEELSKITKTEREKSNMKINFEMKETRLDFPLDDTKSKTKVLRFNFNFILTLLMNSEYDNIKDGFGRVIRTNYITNNMKMSAKCVNIGFAIANFQNGVYSVKNICDNMLQGFRFTTNIDSFLLLPHREKTVMAINVNFEPLIFNIGFRQIKTLLTFLPKLSEFLTDMYKDYDDPLKELNKQDEILIEDENNIINENKINLEEKEENLTEEEKKEKEKRDRKKI